MSWNKGGGFKGKGSGVWKGGKSGNWSPGGGFSGWGSGGGGSSFGGNGNNGVNTPVNTLAWKMDMDAWKEEAFSASLMG